MTNFKPKANKKISIDKKSIITVDNTHQQYLNTFDKQEKLLPKLEKQKDELKNKLAQQKNIADSQKRVIQDTIHKLSKQIKNIQKQRVQYYVDNSKYIFEYFEYKQNVIANTNKKVLLNNFFKKRSSKEDEIESNEITASKKYLFNLDATYLDINDYYENYRRCKCGGENVNIENEGVAVCNKCGVQQVFLIEHEKSSYKEPPKEVSFYAYKRINHFREILAQFQAKESTHINDEILENIKRQIKKERITMDQLTNEKTKQILKNLGYNKYYEHISFIKDKLGIKPLVMSVELETKLCNLFIEIQRPYSKFCPDERMNFLNYYYVLYKLCELLGEDHYLPHFYMLKDPVKRIEQDEIWKKICEHLQWEFIPTL